MEPTQGLAQGSHILGVCGGKKVTPGDSHTSEVLTSWTAGVWRGLRTLLATLDPGAQVPRLGLSLLGCHVTPGEPERSEQGHPEWAPEATGRLESRHSSVAEVKWNSVGIPKAASSRSH